MTFPISYANLFYRSKRSEYILKSSDEESSLPEILQRNPGGYFARSGECPMLRGTDGKQVNMASEQRTEL